MPHPVDLMAGLCGMETSHLHTKVTGRIICALMGLALMAAGVAISLSIIGAIVGIPLIAFGFLMTIRALF